jgi:diacylglycerol kinase (ATP)
MIVEVLNTAVEAACDALSREFNADIQLAKDCGSLAVLLAVALVAGVWILAIAGRVGGFPL